MRHINAHLFALTSALLILIGHAPSASAQAPRTAVPTVEVTTNDDRDRDYNGSFCHHDTSNDNDIYGHTIKQHGSKGAREH